MTVLFGVLEEEQKRLGLLKNRYGKEIEKRPKGAATIKKRGNQSYVYINVRERGHIKSQYIGPLNSSKAKQLQGQIQERKKYRSWLKEVIADLKVIERVLHAKRRQQKD